MFGRRGLHRGGGFGGAPVGPVEQPVEQGRSDRVAFSDHFPGVGEVPVRLVGVVERDPVDVHAVGAGRLDTLLPFLVGLPAPVAVGSRRVGQFACPVGLVLVGVFGEPGDQVVVPGVDLVALLRRVGVRVESVVATFDPPEIRVVAAAVPPVAQHGPGGVTVPAGALPGVHDERRHPVLVVGANSEPFHLGPLRGAVAAVAREPSQVQAAGSDVGREDLRHPFFHDRFRPAVRHGLRGCRMHQFVHDDPPVPHGLPVVASQAPGHFRGDVHRPVLAQLGPPPGHPGSVTAVRVVSMELVVVEPSVDRELLALELGQFVLHERPHGPHPGVDRPLGGVALHPTRRGAGLPSTLFPTDRAA